MGYRRKAREYAVQGLYIYEIKKDPLEKILELPWVEKKTADSTKLFSQDLIKGTIDNLTTIDEQIQRWSKNWDFNRISSVEKAILRISLYALLFLPEIPPKVTIDEAVELGKIFSDEKSGKFINGLLDAAHQNLLQEDKNKK